jgi:hypothetical protein
MNAPAPSLLILSFSPLASDPRVRRQITLFADRYHVTTVGFGPGSNTCSSPRAPAPGPAPSNTCSVAGTAAPTGT